MIDPSHLADRLRTHQVLYRQLLQLVEQESQALRGAEFNFSFCQRRQELLPELDGVLGRIKSDRQQWLALDAEERGRFPEIPILLRDTQDLIMKIIVLDRDNEQTLLRRGLLPANRLPPAQRQQPHYVAQLYQRRHTD